ncbi:MAG: hypothetical protein AAGE03_07130 [Pseudomonadota bacterium]
MTHTILALLSVAALTAGTAIAPIGGQENTKLPPERMAELQTLMTD